MRHPQNEKADAAFTRSSSSLPRAREITLAAPTPNRLEMAERNIKAGIHTVTAVSMASFPASPTKKVSAML